MPGVPNKEIYKAAVLHQNPITNDKVICPFGYKDAVDNIKYLRKDFFLPRILLQPEPYGRHKNAFLREDSFSEGILLQPEHYGRHNKNAFRIFTPSCEVLYSTDHSVTVKIDRHPFDDDHPLYPKYFYDQIRYVDFHAKSNYRRVLFGWKPFCLHFRFG